MRVELEDRRIEVDGVVVHRIGLVVVVRRMVVGAVGSLLVAVVAVLRSLAGVVVLHKVVVVEDMASGLVVVVVLRSPGEVAAHRSLEVDIDSLVLVDGDRAVEEDTENLEEDMESLEEDIGYLCHKV